MPPDAEPHVLFSPQPGPRKPEPMVGERGHDSALFELSRLEEGRATPSSHRQDESSGSGLVNILQFVPQDDSEGASQDSTPPSRTPPVQSLVGPARLVVPPDAVVEPARATAVPTYALVVAIIGLLLAALALTWKALS